jgi:hypothetical protein
MWLFAMRYWTLSKILESTLKKSNPDQQFNKLAAVTWIGFSFFVVISLTFSLLMFYGESARFIFVTPAFLWSTSFIFLLSALYRIKQVMKSLTDVVIIYEAFFLYAATAFLAIVG